MTSTARTDWEITRGVLIRRFFAFLLDCALILMFSFFVSAAILVLGIFTLGLGFLMWHIVPWLPFLYLTITVGSEGATPGQRALGLAVRQEHDLSPPTMAQAFVWTILLFVNFAFSGLPFLVALFTPRHRAAHDLLAGLVVVRQPQIFY